MWCANISQLTHCSNTGYSPDRTLMSLCRHFICIIFPEIQGETESRGLAPTSSRWRKATKTPSNPCISHAR